MEIDLGRVLDALPTMVWTALPDGHIDFVNRRWSEYTGLSLDEAHGWNWQAAVDPDDLPKLLERWRSLLASGEPGELEARVRCFDGQYRWHLVHCNPMFNDAGQIGKWCGTATDVDDFRRAETELRRRELDFQLIVDSIPIPVAVTTPSGEVEGLNQLTLDYFGKTFEELKGWKASEVVHPDDLERTIAAQLEAHRQGHSYNVESRHRRADGVYRWYNVLGLPLRDPQGNILRWFHFLIDIDDRKRAEEALREGEQSSRLIVDSIPGMIAVFLPGGELETVNRQLIAYYGKTLEELKRWEAGELTHPEDISHAVEVFTKSLASGEPFEVEVRARRFDGVYRWFQSRAFPLRDTEGHIACWYNLLVDIDERKRAEEALIASEREARLIVDSIPAGIEVLSPTGEVEGVNKHVAMYFGKTAEELKLAGLTGLIHPEDLQRVRDTASHSTTTGVPYDAVHRFLGADGKYRWFNVRGLPLRDADGRILRWYALHIDIDDLKRAEEALRGSERNLKLIIDTIPALAWSARLDGTAEFFNQHFLDYMGLSAQQAQDWGWTVTVHPDDLSGLAATWQTILASGMPGEAEARLRHHDGEYRWFLFRANPLRDGSGSIVKWYGVNTDIEDRKRAEEALRAKERDLGLTINTIPVMAWSALPDGSAQFFNQHYLHYVGLSIGQSKDWEPTTALSEYWDLTAAVHPDDVTGLAATWQAILASGESGETEARVRRFDGKYRWFLFRANPLRDELGNIIKWYGTNTEIDGRKRAEEALRESERQSRLIVDTIPGLVAIFGPGGEIEGLNEQFLGYLGQTLEEFANWATNGTVHPDDLARHVETLTHSLDSGHPIDFETRLRRFDGVYRWFQLRGHPARDPDGRIGRWYCLMTDVDDRRRAEDELRRSEAFLADAQRLSRTGSFSWQVEAEEMEWSEETYRIYELDPGTPVTFGLVLARVHPDNLSPLQEVMGRARREGDDFDYETRLLMPDQSIKHLRVVAHSVRNKDGKIELRGAVQDVTASRLAEEALEKVRSELGHVTRIMSLGALTASIAHEVNQPLSGIVTNASTCLRMLAADPPKIDVAQETARRTIRDGNRAADVIARLRALFTKRTATIEPVDLNDAVREVIALSSRDLQRGRVVLRTELADALEPVGGDRIQLQQVVMNLVRNATDAMSGVDDRPRRLVIRTQPDEEGGIRLSVKDVGIGFGPAGAARLFEAFYTTKSDGMGIGLSVSRSIVEMHNGRLWASQNDGPGVTFSFSIPPYFGVETPMRQAGARPAPITSSAQNAAGIS